MSWRPHRVTSTEALDAGPVAALGALLDSGAPVPAAGDVLPPLWHWVALPRWPASSVIGVDGHPRRGDFLPPIDLPRRMFAGGEVTFHGDLRVDTEVVRESEVVSVEEKSGRSGRLAIVTVVTRLLDAERDDLLVEERQDLIYRDAAPAPTSFPDPEPASAIAPAGPPLVAEDDGWRFVTDPTLLMRFSAATANPHRIHYDWPYATRVEGYPGLVVHGPLSTLVLAEALRLAHPDRVVRHLLHRNTAPLFCGDPAQVRVDRPNPDTTPDSVEVALRRPDDTVLADLTADLTPSSPKGTNHE
ncbi:MaoC family dehydratase N-terminal domain-containing protein [Nocardioides sp. YIM B13467]|uniref:FAS1-like dehydratase domain-containing protein n=1 Tax=Nocardioides sp. YIM B13467 TaxID=3366294 RepID=UPI003672F3AD